MKQSYFIMAESVHVYDRAKLVIVGTFDVIQSQTIPFTCMPFGIAVRIVPEKAEIGRILDAKLSFRKAESRSPIMLEVPLKLSFRKGEAGLPASATAALKVPPLTFDSVGDYVFEIKVDRKRVARTTLYVRKAPRISAQAKKTTRPRKPPPRKK